MSRGRTSSAIGRDGDGWRSGLANWGTRPVHLRRYQRGPEIFDVLLTGLTRVEIEPVKEQLADSLYRNIPAGVGSNGKITLDPIAMEAMLTGGARWTLGQGYGRAADLERIEEKGVMAGAEPDAVSDLEKERQRQEIGTLGSGNHYLEVQKVAEIHDPAAASAFGLVPGTVVVSIHCGSRGLGHQIGTEYLREMAIAAPSHGINLPDLELACAPLASPLRRRYLGPCARPSTARWPTGRC
jgi:tRNA-splicing ligase RtcB